MKTLIPLLLLILLSSCNTQSISRKEEMASFHNTTFSDLEIEPVDIMMACREKWEYKDSVDFNFIKVIDFENPYGYGLRSYSGYIIGLDDNLDFILCIYENQNLSLQYGQKVFVEDNEVLLKNKGSVFIPIIVPNNQADFLLFCSVKKVYYVKVVDGLK